MQYNRVNDTLGWQVAKPAARCSVNAERTATLMARRQEHHQQKHDAKVRQIALGLEREGWSVQADIPGYDQPDPIGADQRVPDIWARKKGAERLVEVETKGTLSRDTDQHATFRRSVGQKQRASFVIEEA